MNLPNKITMLRVIMIPFFAFFMLTDMVEGSKYIAVAIFDAGDRIQTMNAMDEIFSYLDEDMKYLIFTTIQKLYYLSDEGYKELERTVEIYKADLEVDGE